MSNMPGTPDFKKILCSKNKIQCNYTSKHGSRSSFQKAQEFTFLLNSLLKIAAGTTKGNQYPVLPLVPLLKSSILIKG